jgi:hypothetical protein
MREIQKQSGRSKENRVSSEGWTLLSALYRLLRRYRFLAMTAFYLPFVRSMSLSALNERTLPLSMSYQRENQILWIDTDTNYPLAI